MYSVMKAATVSIDFDMPKCKKSTSYTDGKQVYNVMKLRIFLCRFCWMVLIFSPKEDIIYLKG